MLLAGLISSPTGPGQGASQGAGVYPWRVLTVNGWLGRVRGMREPTQGTDYRLTSCDSGS
jgi:hypothetical protein